MWCRSSRSHRSSPHASGFSSRQQQAAPLLRPSPTAAAPLLCAVIVGDHHNFDDTISDDALHYQLKTIQLNFPYVVSCTNDAMNNLFSGTLEQFKMDRLSRFFRVYYSVGTVSITFHYLFKTRVHCI